MERWPGSTCSQAGIAQAVSPGQKTSIFVQPISEVLGIEPPTIEVDSEQQYRAFELLKQLSDSDLELALQLLQKFAPHTGNPES